MKPEELMQLIARMWPKVITLPDYPILVRMVIAATQDVFIADAKLELRAEEKQEAKVIEAAGQIWGEVQHPRSKTRVANLRSKTKMERARNSGNSTMLALELLENADKPVHIADIVQYAKVSHGAAYGAMRRLREIHRKRIVRVGYDGKQGLFVLHGSRAARTVWPRTGGPATNGVPESKEGYGWRNGRLVPVVKLGERSKATLNALAAAGKDGALCREVAELTGINVTNASTSLHHLRKAGKLRYTLDNIEGEPARHRYYLLEHAPQEAKP